MLLRKVEARESLVDRNREGLPIMESMSPSRLARASWIEMEESCRVSRVAKSRGSREPRGSKFIRYSSFLPCTLSRLARASWIEIISHSPSYASRYVEARESLVDRNMFSVTRMSPSTVEARESLVDRNNNRDVMSSRCGESRLARASWIEITTL